MPRVPRSRHQACGEKMAHGEEMAHVTKSKFCKSHILGVCGNGDGCRFAHNREELNPRPKVCRTQLCKTLANTGLPFCPQVCGTKLCKTLVNTGSCEDPQCEFVHNATELQQEQQQRQQQQLKLYSQLSPQVAPEKQQPPQQQLPNQKQQMPHMHEQICQMQDGQMQGLLQLQRQQQLQQRLLQEHQHRLQQEQQTQLVMQQSMQQSMQQQAQAQMVQQLMHQIEQQLGQIQEQQQQMQQEQTQEKPSQHSPVRARSAANCAKAADPEAGLGMSAKPFVEQKGTVEATSLGAGVLDAPQWVVKNTFLNLEDLEASTLARCPRPSTWACGLNLMGRTTSTASLENMPWDSCLNREHDLAAGEHLPPSSDRPPLAPHSGPEGESAVKPHAGSHFSDTSVGDSATPAASEATSDSEPAAGSTGAETEGLGVSSPRLVVKNTFLTVDVSEESSLKQWPRPSTWACNLSLMGRSASATSLDSMPWDRQQEQDLDGFAGPDVAEAQRLVRQRSSGLLTAGSCANMLATLEEDEEEALSKSRAGSLVL